MEFYFLVIVLLSHCGGFFGFGYRLSFIVVSSSFLSMVIQPLVVILVFP